MRSGGTNHDYRPTRSHPLRWHTGAHRRLCLRGYFMTKSVPGPLTAKKLREFLKYDPRTGVLTWIKFLNGRVPIGSEAGIIWDGYRHIKFGGKLYRAHRLAWLWMTGKWPRKNLDHRDCNGLNNRWSNLREADLSENGFNRRTSKRNTTGFKGVSFNKLQKKFEVRLQVRGVSLFLGRWPTAKEAHAKYVKASKKYHGEFARTA